MELKSLRVGLVADELTRSCLMDEVSVIDVLPSDGRTELASAKLDLLLVESAWFGADRAWRHKIAAYPRLWLRSNRKLRRLAAMARDLGIPTVFWNKEDGVHFDRFINSARHFDHVLTVDANCVDRYRAVMGADASVGILPFPIQPRIHNFTGFNFRENNANFVGSYSTHIHDGRRAWQEMAFGAAIETGLGLTVYDRNSDRPSQTYRYPQLTGLDVRPAVHHTKTAQIYKDHLVSLNVNTVTDSETMFSRRLVEILACGGIAVTSPARSVDALFRDYCQVISTADEARALFERLRHGPSNDDLDRARDGAEYVRANHTWAQRLEQIAAVAGV